MTPRVSSPSDTRVHYPRTRTGTHGLLTRLTTNALHCPLQHSTPFLASEAQAAAVAAGAAAAAAAAADADAASDGAAAFARAHSVGGADAGAAAAATAAAAGGGGGGGSARLSDGGATSALSGGGAAGSSGLRGPMYSMPPYGMPYPYGHMPYRVRHGMYPYPPPHYYRPEGASKEGVCVRRILFDNPERTKTHKHGWRAEMRRRDDGILVGCTWTARICSRAEGCGQGCRAELAICWHQTCTAR